MTCVPLGLLITCSIQTIGLAMVSYSHAADYSSTAAAFLASLSHGLSYWRSYVPFLCFVMTLLNPRPNKKASKFIELTQSDDVTFTKSFWSLLDTTLAKHWGKVIGPSLAVGSVHASVVAVDIDFVVAGGAHMLLVSGFCTTLLTFRV